MKKMEFMREAAKVLMDFFSELYIEKSCPLQTISLKKQQGSFKLRNAGTLSFYIYMTGSISYNTISIINERTKYHTYYVYQADDNHQQVLEKFAQDLRTLKDYFDDVFLFTIDGADPFKFTVFEYGKPFATKLCKNGDDLEEDERNEDPTT